MMIDIILLGVYSLIIGFCVGSFLNVVALRAFSDESIVFPPSKCPKCGNKLKWYHNIPLLSYMFLRGKCAFCKEKISIQYPIVEFLTGVLFLLSFLLFGLSLNTLFAWIFIAFLVAMSVTDIKEKVVFNSHVYSFIVVMYILSLIKYPLEQWWMGLAGIIVAFIIFEVLARLGYLIVDSRMFGEGDTFIAMGIGAFLGTNAVIAVTILSILIQVIFMFPIMFVKSIKNKDKDMIKGLSLALFAVVISILFNLYSYNLDVWAIYTILTILIVMPALFAIYFILKNIKTKKTEDLTMPPFGPALAVAGILVMFVINILSI